jgi:hypothetical protein
MADMQGGILLSSSTLGFFHRLEVDITLSYRPLGPVCTHVRAGHLVKIGPTGVYFDVKRNDPLAHGDMIDVHLHVPVTCGVLNYPGCLSVIGKVVTCKQLVMTKETSGSYSYRLQVVFCRRPRLLEYG